jgi:hypothetical protein
VPARGQNESVFPNPDRSAAVDGLPLPRRVPQYQDAPLGAIHDERLCARVLVTYEAEEQR